MKFYEYWDGVLERRPLDLVKLDIEGHELHALEGFGTAVDHSRVIQFEFGGCNKDTRTFFKDFFYFFADHCFDLFRMSPFGIFHVSSYSEREEFFHITNNIAVNRAFRGQL